MVPYTLSTGLISTKEASEGMLGYDVASHGILELVAAGVGFETQSFIQGVKFEKVMVGAGASWWARACVFRLTSIVWALDSTARHAVNSYSYGRSWDIPHRPVYKITRNSIWIVHYQGQAFSAARDAHDRERRADILTFAGVLRRDGRTISKSLAG